MSTATLTIQPSGSASITLDGTTSTFSAAGIQAAQAVGMRQVKRHATRTGAPVNVQIIDPQGTTHLHVAVDGGITRATPPQPDLEPAWAQPQQEPAPGPEYTGPAADWAPPAPEEAAVAPAAATVGTPQVREIPTEEPTEAAPEPAEVDLEWDQRAQQPATQGWKGALNGLGLTLAPSDAELVERRAAYDNELAEAERQRLEQEAAAQREAESARQRQEQQTRREARRREEEKTAREQRRVIQTTYGEPKTVAFMNEKGGVGKTTDTYCIGATMGRIRGGDVIAWDANETRGTLGFRAQKDSHTRSVVDLLEEAADDFTTVQGSKRATLTRYTRGQGDNLFGVIASDQSRDRQDLVDGDAFVQVHEILSRFYSLILIDTGNNHRVSHFTSALEATDQLVIPVSAGADGAYAAEVMLDNFTSLGHAELVKNAVVLLHDSATRRGDAGAIAQRFEDRVRAIIPIPFDSALDTGDEIDYDVLAPATRAAYQEAAAAISEGLASTTKE